MSGKSLLAAVDLGSNSFRLLIGRVESNRIGAQILPLDSLKEPVRLAAGLDAKGQLDADSQRRALGALSRFAERLRSFRPEAVRAVATNTLRVARNGRHFLGTAEAALGFPIEVISGLEEARLIYLGAAHALPQDGLDRLVVDIGGGSTECIIGADYTPALLESAGTGCVTLTQRYFPSGAVDAESFRHACFHARDVFAPIAATYRRRGWQYAVGTSGSAKALAQLCQLNFGVDELNRDGLRGILDALLAAGHIDKLRLEGLRADRRPVLAGGLAAMFAVFEELGVDSMRYCPAALRQGVLYDLLGRDAGADMREITVAQMVTRHAVDVAHANRVVDSALALFDQGARGAAELLAHRRDLLRWATRLAEIGMTISHEDYHKHSAYIVSNGDMPGFSQSEQAMMSRVALGQTGGLRKLKGLVADELEWLMVLSLRLATILHRRRDDDVPPSPALFFRRGKVRVEMAGAWAKAHPLTDESLENEAAIWRDAGVFEEFNYQRI